MITTNTRLIAIGGSLLLLIFIVELIRRRRLKEEYSVLWIATGLVLLVLSAWYSLLVKVTDLIGGVAPSSTLFFFGLLFVIFMLLHFSVRTSQLERRLTALIQEVGILSAKHPLGAEGEEDLAKTEQGTPETSVPEERLVAGGSRVAEGPRARA
jgi:hypothetical protein